MSVCVRAETKKRMYWESLTKRIRSRNQRTINPAEMKRIGILTAGGDTPAMNATIQGAVVRANQLRIEIFGLIKGFNSLFNPRVPHVHLNPLYQEIPEIDPTKGGTMIGSSRDYVDPCIKDELKTLA